MLNYLKKTLLSISFQIGVNVIGIPEFHKIEFANKQVSKFHK